MISLDKYVGTNCIRTYPMENGYITPPVRFTDKENNQSERNLYSNYWREQIDMYGQKVLYYRNKYNVDTADNIYGEQPLAGFVTPQFLIMGITLSENALALSKFGIQSDDTVTAYLHISTFYSVFPTNSEPKAGDVFKLVEYGSDRPGERDGKMFEITERCDEDNSQINPLMGHYVWLLKAKRFDYSFEPDIVFEKGSNQVHDDTFYGDLSGSTTTPVQRVSSYPGDADAESKASVFDMRVNNTLVYGGYY
jgi:hypothetical protein